MTTLNITFENDSTFPVYCKYPMQHSAQPAYITLDLEDGELTASYNSEMGGSTPSRQWHNIVLTFPIPSTTTGDEIQSLIEKYENGFQEILDDSKVMWDGYNRVGILGQKANKIYGSFQDIGCESTACIIENSEDLENFFGEDVYIKEGETLEGYKSRLESANGESNYHFVDNFNVLSTALDLHEKLLEDFDEDDIETWIPKNIAQELEDRGRDEFKEELGIILLLS